MVGISIQVLIIGCHHIKQTRGFMYNRSELDFANEVKYCFSFLTEEYDFTYTDEEVNFLKLESDRFFINIFHGQRSFEIGLEIGLIKPITKMNCFNIDEIINALNESANEKWYYQTSDKVLVKEGVQKLATLLKKHIDVITKMNDDVFLKLENKRAKEWNEYILQMKAEKLRKSAESAFKLRNFKLVIDCYNEIYDLLTPAELLKLNYAQKKYKD